MIVLGIHDGHDAGACLLVNGKIVAFSAEERRLNRKNFTGVPKLSIETVLQMAGVKANQINLIAISGIIRTASLSIEKDQGRSIMHLLNQVGARSQLGVKIGRAVLSRMRKSSALEAYLDSSGLGLIPRKIFDHHECHAACAFFNRPWEGDATVLTLDGAGDGICATVSLGKDTAMKKIAQTPKYHSIASFMYSGITSYLGMKPYEHEYKIMGLAPYGHPERCLKVFQDMFEVRGMDFRNNSGVSLPQIEKVYSEALRKKRFDDIAAACQAHFETLVTAWVKNAIEKTNCRRIVAAGGAFLNVKANKLIREMPEVERLYVFPAADDGSMPYGAALLGHLHLSDAHEKNPIAPQKLNSMHLGLEFTESEVSEAIHASGMSFRKVDHEANEVAELLASGKIVGRFFGREEVGPRALGNRSILADPRDLAVVRKLNFAIKQRDFWMPFAGSVLLEDAEKYIRNANSDAEFMIEAFDTTEEGAKYLQAAIHPFDRTIRPQIVHPSNGPYHAILSAFKAKTGVGALLNTSLNLHGSPIVGSPAIALQTLAQSDLDAISFGSHLVFREPKL